MAQLSPAEAFQRSCLPAAGPGRPPRPRALSWSWREGFYRRMERLVSSGGVTLNYAVLLRQLWDLESSKGRRWARRPARALATWCRRVDEGECTLSTALRGWLPHAEVVAITVGERTGELGAGFAQARKLGGASAQVRATAISTLTYPLLMVGMVIVVLMVIGEVLVPEMTRIVPLEQWRSGTVYGIYLLYRYYASGALWATVGGVFAWVLLAFLALPRWTGRGRRAADATPIFSAYKRLQGLMLMMAMSSMMAFGVSMEQCLVTSVAGSTRWLRGQLSGVLERVANGEALGAALAAEDPRFPSEEILADIALLAGRDAGFASVLSERCDSWFEEELAAIGVQLKLVQMAMMVLVSILMMVMAVGAIGLSSLVQSSLQSGF